ncbi:MAG TPA: ABC transporter substrate-binding protein [bacterium]|nr:ABC transporter substrate-binding protein [bacterium]
MKWARTAMLAAGLALALAAAMGSPIPPSHAAAAGTVTVAQGAEPATLDPLQEISRTGYNVTLQIYDPLFMRNPAGRIVPMLASGYKIVNPTTWQFSLRKGVKFHNGEPFDAAAVKFTIERAMLKDSPSNYLVDGVKSVRAVDPYTVEVTTADPLPLLLPRLMLLGIAPPKYYQERGASYVATHPVGTGPYRFQSWVKDDRLTLTANHDYWGGAPSIQTVVFRLIPDPAARVAAFRSGEVDLITDFAPDLVPSVANDPRLKVAVTTGTRSINIMLDTQTGPLRDKRVRQALNYAVDKDTIVKNILGGFGTVESTLVPAAYLGFNPRLKPYAYDPAKAKALLAQAGYPNGFPIVFQSPRGRYLADAQVSQAVVGYLKAAGVNADLKYYEWGNYVNMYFKHQLGPIFLIGSASAALDAADALENVSCGVWDSWYCNQGIQAMYTKAIATVQPDRRAAQYREIQPLIYDEAPIIFMYAQKGIYGVNARLNWTPQDDETLWLAKSTVK